MVITEIFRDIIWRIEQIWYHKMLAISNLSLNSLYYAEACNKYAVPISTSLRPGNTAPFEEMLQ